MWRHTYEYASLSFSSGWLYAYTDFYFTHTKTKVIIISLFSQQLTFLYLKRAKTSKVDKWWSDLFTRDFSIETKTFVEANTMETEWININDISSYVHNLTLMYIITKEGTYDVLKNYNLPRSLFNICFACNCWILT